MGSRSSALLALAVAAAPACRLHVARVEVGGGWSPARAETLSPGSADRAAVLAALGPPDVVSYTRTEEVLLYRRAEHRGTDLRFLIPDLGLTLARPGIEQVEPEVAADVEPPPDQAWPVAIVYGLLGTLAGLASPGSTEEALALHSRALRWDVVRVVLDRGSLAVRKVEVFLGIDDADAARIARGALLLEDA